MSDIRIAVAQFEPKDGDKTYNLSVIDKLTSEAKSKGAEVVCFHELSITAYTFLKDLTLVQIRSLSEKVPDGKSCQALIDIAKKHDVTILAGLVENDDESLFNTYVCVDGAGLKARFRKIHPFISKYLASGDEYVVFEIKGWKCGILICYDNNVIENVRATTLLGAEIIFAPHVTACTPSAMPGRGYVDDKLWQNRKKDPVPLRQEFDGPKGRGWLLRWLPARAYDNGVYYAFTNPIGYDGEHLKNGNAMLLDPYGEILSEVRSFEDAITTATLTKEKLTLAGGYRYRNARKPELYGEILSAAHQSKTKPVWMKND
ncbi:putative amidohydrolase [Catalinimonas alkaloidigena]|uniref:nitrilase family protein n=1 Tax=Catalinimonas alkaloidigena TaxID=1075417 RepID=UPI002404E097|nr:nitrilase family protein [Catalinimonas alkaloidigena]MDF9797154.1 putative amidohydrolase [Catalinimonas alkaloidigena]